MVIIKFKFIILFLLTITYIMKKNILINFIIIDHHFIRDNNFLLKEYLKLKELELSKEFIQKNKYNLIRGLSNKSIKNIKNVKNIFLNSSCRFGNCILYLNKYISYCEVIGCKSILLRKKYFWFIKNNIILKNNIIIKIGDSRNFTNYLKCKINFNKFYNIKPQIKINLIRNEIIGNLPNIKLSKKDLYIHIRSDDIFKYKIKSEHIQPPLCFYKRILNHFNFEKIIIISSDNGNLVINKLLKHYSNITFKIKNLKKDISILINAYNLVSSTSSFFIGALQLNYNIRFLWDYNIYTLGLKNMVFHYDLYKFINRNIIIYRMEPSKKYKNIIFFFNNIRRQIKLILKEQCINNFKIINYKTD